MINYKQEASKQAFDLIKPGQVIGLGDGSTALYLTGLIAADHDLADTLTLTTSSAKTLIRMRELGLTATPLADLKAVDKYFDGCDQFDRELNALKSGSGIHSVEKILAGMAEEFILMGDLEKYAEYLTSDHPVVVEILPAALSAVSERSKMEFPLAAQTLRPALSDRENHLLELKFSHWPALDQLNTCIKMMPGVLDHSLFYHMAGRAIISGPDGTRIISPAL